MVALLLGRRGLRLGDYGRRGLHLLRCRLTRGQGRGVRGRRSRHSGHGCSSGGQSHRGLLRGWQPGHLNPLEGGLVVIPGKKG